MRLSRQRVEIIRVIIPTRRFQMGSVGAEDEGQASLTRDLDRVYPNYLDRIKI